VCRFRGTVTDLTLDHLSTTPATPVVTVTAIGFLAKLGLLTTGEDAYSKEVVRDRVDRVMADAGLSYLNAADNDLELKSNNEPARSNPKSTTYRQLAEWSGGTFFDDCRGRVIFEDYGERGIAGNPGIWENAPEPFSFYTQAWDAFPANNAAPQLPASAIAWTPQWRKDLQTVINDIEVEYGNESLYELVDNGSIAAYGRRQYDLKTELFGLTDAHRTRPSKSSPPKRNRSGTWAKSSILMNKLTTEQRDRAPRAPVRVPRHHQRTTRRQPLHPIPRHRRRMERDIPTRLARPDVVPVRPPLQLPSRRMGRARPRHRVGPSKPRDHLVRRSQRRRPPRRIERKTEYARHKWNPLRGIRRPSLGLPGRVAGTRPGSERPISVKNLPKR
jgi:hypothetical protein